MDGPSRDKIPLSRGYPQLVQVRGILGQQRRGQRGSEGHIQREGGGLGRGGSSQTVWSIYKERVTVSRTRA